MLAAANPALVEYVLFFSFVAIGLFGGAWIFLYQALGRRLKAKGIGPKPNPSGRVNGMDAFFGKLKILLLSEDRAFGDAAITRICLAIKFCTVLIALSFLAMVFGPFFMSDH